MLDLIFRIISSIPSWMFLLDLLSCSDVFLYVFCKYFSYIKVRPKVLTLESLHALISKPHKIT